MVIKKLKTEQKDTPVVKTAQEKKDEPTQQELNDKLKSEAVQADFVELNVDNPPLRKKVYIDGKVSVLTKGVLDEFTITSKEGNGYGMYHVTLFNTTDTKYSEGDQVRIYGTVGGLNSGKEVGKDDSGMIMIIATIIEKK
ncbi:hypothetical protein ACT8ZR_18295 [Neobacillus sp. M.A.Huq-85]